VQKCAAHVEILFPARHEQQSRGAVHGDAQRCNPNNRPGFHLRGMVEPLESLPDDRPHANQQEQGVEKRRQDRSSLPTVGSSCARSPLRQFACAPSHHQPQHVSEVVGGIRQEGQRIREDSKSHFQDDEAGVEKDSNQKRPPEIRGSPVMMAMMVMVVPHGESAPRKRGDVNGIDLLFSGNFPVYVWPPVMSSLRISFFQRLGSTLGLWALIVLALFAGSEYGYFLPILFVAMVALYEYFQMVKELGAPVFTLTGMLCGALYMVASFFSLRSRSPDHSDDLELAVLVGFLFVVFSRQMFRAAARRDSLEAIAYTVFGLLYIPWLFNFLTKIIYLTPRAENGDTTGQFYLIYLMVVTKFSDMGAYVFGSLFGRHPFAPHISPKKTWEGLLGALLLSSLGSFWLYAWIPGRLGALRIGDVVALGLLLGCGAIVGDLAESIIKRSTHAKDSSRILPGIGGTLDLIDSLLFTAPLLYFYLRLVIGVS
jgi:phosphatidate cytidylyltransferase